MKAFLSQVHARYGGVPGGWPAMASRPRTCNGCVPSSWRADRVPPLKACLIDVYDTILASAFPQREQALAALAGVDDDLGAPSGSGSPSTGTWARSHGRVVRPALAACGLDPTRRWSSRLVRATPS